MTDRNNKRWLSDLSEPGSEQEIALGDLRAIIRSGLPFALSKWISPSDPHFDALAEEVAQDTLLKVMDKLGTFEGRSKFTTWVYKIAVRVALTELRRKRWKDISLEELTETENGEINLLFLADTGVGPEMATEQADMMSHLRRIILEELTDKQRTAIVAAQINGMPIEEVARRMDMTRNALYKLIHDARLRLKKRMAEEGLSPEDVLQAFEIG